MENKAGLFLALLGFVALFITLLSNAPDIAKTFLTIIFLVITCLGILLQTRWGDFLRENVEHNEHKGNNSYG